MQNRRWRIQRACTNASTHSCGEHSRQGKNYQIPDNNLVSLTKTWRDDAWLQRQPKRCSFPHKTRVKHGATYQKQHMNCLLEHRALSCGHAGLTLKVTELSSGRWEKETTCVRCFDMIRSESWCWKGCEGNHQVLGKLLEEYMYFFFK